MFPQAECSGEEGDGMGVSFFFWFRGLMVIPNFHHFSLPAALHYEKFNIPDNIRILDGIVETLTY